MRIVVVPTASQPNGVQLAGCEQCGVTSNELPQQAPAIGATNEGRG